MMWQRAVRSLRFVSRVYSSAADDAWKLTHVSQDRALPHMVNVGSKPITQRSATACTTIRLPPTVLTELLKGGGDQLLGPKGPIASTAVIAGVLGAKQTSLLLPFCHPLPLEDCQVTIQVIKPNIIEIQCQVQVTQKTGVEMEALTGVSIAALCVYDMCKALSHDIVIENTRLIQKTGGKTDVTHPNKGTT